MSVIRRGVLRGAFWTVMANGGNRIMGLVSVGILARLLTPADFGLIGMGFAATAAVECLTTLRFEWALVRQPEIDREQLDTAWTLRIIVNGVGCLVLIPLAYWAADYFHEPRLTAVVLVLALVKLINAFENIGMVFFRRELRFEKEFQVLFYTRLISFAVVLPTALLHRSYVALLAGLIAERLANVSMSYVLQPFRPRLRLSVHRHLLFFSVWMQVWGIVQTIRDRTSDFVLGRAAGPHAVAMFSLSNEMANLAVTELAAPINRAVFSGYAKFAHDVERLREAYVNVTSLLWLICLPIAVGIACTAPQIVVLFLGSQWIEAIPVLQLLAIGGLATVVVANTQDVFMTVGRPSINAVISFIGLILLVPAVIVLASHYGARGSALAYVMVSFATIPLVFWSLRRVIGVKLGQLRGQAWRPGIGALAMACVVQSINPNEPDLSFSTNLVQLLGLAFVGAAVFVACVYVAWRLSGRPTGAETQLVDLARSALRAVSQWGLDRKNETS